MATKSLPDQTCHRRILLVEDEYFIAEDVRRQLEQLEAEVVGPVGSVEQGRRLVEEDGLDLAILDINLRGEFVYSLADMLIEQGIPILFTTGYDEAVIPDRFAGVKRCIKPVTNAALRKAIVEL